MPLTSRKYTFKPRRSAPRRSKSSTTIKSKVKKAVTKAVRTQKKKTFTKNVTKVLNKHLEQYYAYARALYSPPLTSPTFNGANYHFFNLTGSLAFSGQTLIPNDLMGLIPSAYGGASTVASTQGLFMGQKVYAKNTFSTIKITMPLFNPSEISPDDLGNQSRFWAQNWQFRFLIFKSKPYPTRTNATGGGMLDPMTNVLKTFQNGNFGPSSPTTDAPAGNLVPTIGDIWVTDDLMFSKFNSTNFTKLHEERFTLSLPEFIGYDQVRYDPSVPTAYPYVNMAGGKKYPSTKTIHFRMPINKTLQYETNADLPPEAKSYPLNYDTSTMVMCFMAPVGDYSQVQETGMNTFINRSINIDVNSRYSYTDA